LQAHFYKMSKYRNRRRQLRVSDRRLLKYSMDISPDSALYMDSSSLANSFSDQS
jgi:hypothetical protein